MSDPELFEIETEEENSWKVSTFSAHNKFSQEARAQLEDKYWAITEVTDKFNRQSVSYQLSKKDRLHRWLKYKEGFSAELVRILLGDFGIQPGDNVMDPFMGSGTTALVATMNGMNSYGYDILPMSKLSILTKSRVYEYDVEELERLIVDVKSLSTPEGYTKITPYVSTTRDGYPPQTARDLAYYSDYFNSSSYSEFAKDLLTLCTLNTLESISYSKKDGQYLRWDCRCPKVIAALEARREKGKPPFSVILDKGELPSLKTALLKELTNVVEDIKSIQAMGRPHLADCHFREGSALFELPLLDGGLINAVISSPPYCNRYDYTRTYAMELAYFGIDDAGIRNLRQALLSCTVESKPKIEVLRDYYERLGRLQDFEGYLNAVRNNAALNEILAALKGRDDADEINNKGVIPMVEGYFTELTFIFAELYRVCAPGAHVAFVNDNVRYAGEVIPVDFLTTELAEAVGFHAEKVYSLKQQKGNSSQQMKKYGRVTLRKSITVWRKD